MKTKYLVALILTAFITTSVNAAKPGGGDPPEPQDPGFTGFTTATFNGGQGMVTYTNACGIDHTGSHMCTCEEFLNSKTFPATSVDGWIRPTYVPLAGVSSTTLIITQDMSGTSISARGSLACNGWSHSASSETHYGLFVGFSGKFSVATCQTVKAVACCM